MGAVKAEHERICKNERVIRYPSHFETVLRTVGTRKRYVAEKKASFLCRRVSFALTDNRFAVFRPKMTRNLCAPIQ